jgi:uncharacterized Zn-finger protein
MTPTNAHRAGDAKRDLPENTVQGCRDKAAADILKTRSGVTHKARRDLEHSAKGWIVRAAWLDRLKKSFDKRDALDRAHKQYEVEDVTFNTSRSARLSVENVKISRGVPLFFNELGVKSIEIGVPSFHCMGVLPPHDHPHVYLNMGDDIRVFCPYCSTDFRLNSALRSNETRPPNCRFGI